MTGRLRQERQLSVVPKSLWALLLLALLSQAALRHSSEPLQTGLEELPTLPDTRLIQSFFLGDGVLASRVLSLWLQARDTQSGSLVANRQRDYGQLIQWLEAIQALDSQSHYPLMLAVRVYSQVNDPHRLRQILAAVNQLFMQHPERYWRWQAEAAVLAKHRLKDKALALRYAQHLTAQVSADVLPYWARDMQIILLQDLGHQKELELLVGGLIDSGEITDVDELHWLNQQLLNSDKTRVLTEQKNNHQLN